MTMLLTAIVILFLIFCGVGVPICVLGGSLFFAFVSGASVGNYASAAYYGIGAAQAFLAIPLFIGAGIFIEKSGIARVLVDLADKMLYRIKGGMAATIPVVACFFGALCGSGVATASVLSGMMTPDLVRKGYDKRYVAAFVAASSPFGFMIPPNMNAIVYASITNANVGALFLSTIFPGLIWAGLYLIINRIVYKKWYTPPARKGEKELSSEGIANKNTFKVVRAAIPAFLMPVIVLGGIYSGVFTATEAGAVGCLYAAVVGISWYRRIKMCEIGSILKAIAISTATLMIIVPMTTIFSRVLVLDKVPELITSLILGISENPIVIILIIDLIVFIAGFFLDTNILLLVFVPLLQPAAAAVGISLTQLAVIIFVALGVGSITPPMAMALFACSKTTGVTVIEMVRPLWPFIVFGGIPTLVLVSFIPALSEFLPSVVYGFVQ